MVLHLRRTLPKTEFAVYEFDEPGVPSHTPRTWREERTESWLQIATENRDSGLSTIVCGLVHPDEVLAAPTARMATPSRFTLLTVADRELEDRLRRRYATPLYAQLLTKQTGISPEEFIPTMIPYQQELLRLFSQLEYGTFILDTTDVSEKETSRVLVGWISEQPHK